MNERQRRWSWWAEKGAVAIATLAAVSLAVTVWLTQHALDGAADVLIRGDGDALVTRVIGDLLDADWPVTSQTLTLVLAKHEAERLRYMALVVPNDHRVLAKAGAAAIAAQVGMPGEVVRQDQRVRLVDALARLYARTESRRDVAELVTRPAERGAARPYLVLEFEPPLVARLQRDLARIAVVAALAALLLVALAFAWSRAMARLSAIQRQAEGERRLVALGRASSVMAHELRNPLAGLKGHAQLLMEDLPEPSRAKAARVVEGAERIERLTSVLLDFVRDAPLDVRPVTPAELVDRALAELPKDRVRVDLSAAPKALHVDAERASVALRNLLENAVQASENETALVEVRAFGNGQDVIIEVRDHGSGLVKGAEAQIFDPFVTTKTRGTGLGLAIARRIAEQHHGTLTGETHGQGGAVFRLVLPLISKPARAS
jgi:two-component system sensor histidine kinase HydH